MIVTDMATLKSTPGSSSDLANLLGYHTAGDGGGGVFYWDAASVESDDNGTIIAVTGTAIGRWKRLYSGAINVKWFGAQGNGSADDSQAFQAAADLALDIIVPYTANFYFFESTVRLYSSIRGISSPIIKMTGSRGAGTGTSGAYRIFNIENKQDDKELIIETLTLDGAKTTTTDYTSQQDHCIRIAASSNITIKNNVIKDPWGDCIYVARNATTPDDYNSSNITIENNRLSNPYRGAVVLTSCTGSIIRNNKMQKDNNFVATIDIEPPTSYPAYRVHDILIEKNDIESPNVSKAINILGSNDFINNETVLERGLYDYATKNITIRDNKIQSADNGIYITASGGIIKNIHIYSNYFKCEVFAKSVSATPSLFYIENVLINDCGPLDDSTTGALGSFKSVKNLGINFNNVNFNGSESILEALEIYQSENIKITNNVINSVSHGMWLGLDNNNVSIIDNRIAAQKSCVYLGSGGAASHIDDLKIYSNNLNSATEDIITIKDISLATITNVKIGVNQWTAPAGSFLIKDTAEFNNNAQHPQFTGKKYIYGEGLPNISSLGNDDTTNVYHIEYSGLSDYTTSSVEADKYLYMQDGTEKELIGIGLKGEWIRDIGTDGMPPSTFSKAGQRLTHKNGTVGNTLYLNEGGTFNPVQTIKALDLTDIRPADVPVGYFCLYGGVPIWWNGTNWVDASGVIVP